MEDIVFERLRLKIKEAGTIKAFADGAGISAQYVSDVLAKRRKPGQKIVKAAGLQTVVSYEVVK